MPEVGDHAPAFDAKDAQGQPIRLTDYAGRYLVLYFYPKDSTPGCTTEACDFRDNMATLTSHNIAVVGVSRDSAASHAKFAANHELPFPLIADVDESVCRAYDVIHEVTRCGRTSEGVVRTTYVIDGQGVIRAKYAKVAVKGHVAEVIRLVQSL